MAGCSKKQYAIMMGSGDEGQKLAAKMGSMEQEEFNKAFSELLQSDAATDITAKAEAEGDKPEKYRIEDDEDYGDFDPDDDSEWDEGEDEEKYMDDVAEDRKYEQGRAVDIIESSDYFKDGKIAAEDYEKLYAEIKDEVNPEYDDIDDIIEEYMENKGYQYIKPDEDGEYKGSDWKDAFKETKGWKELPDVNGEMNYEKDYDNYGGVNNIDTDGKLDAYVVKNGEHDKPIRQRFSNSQEAKEWVEEQLIKENKEIDLNPNSELDRLNELNSDKEKVKMSNQATRNKLTGGYTKLGNIQNKFDMNSTIESAKDAYKKMDELKSEFEKMEIADSQDFDKEDKQKLVKQIEDSMKRLSRDWPEVLEDDKEKSHQNFTNRVSKFISSDGSDEELDSMLNDLRKNMSDEDIIKKLATMFKGTVK